MHAVQHGPMSPEQMQAEITRLMQENAQLASRKPSSNGIKVSAKGAISVYGMGRFPVTLYASQWEQLLAKGPEIKAFILANTSLLATKQA